MHRDHSAIGMAKMTASFEREDRAVTEQAQQRAELLFRHSDDDVGDLLRKFVVVAETDQRGRSRVCVDQAHAVEIERSR